jgi:hypothetical protein
VKADVGFYAQLQWIGPEDGIAAIQDGTTDGIGADFDYDRARAYDIISHIKMGPEALFNMPPEVVLLDVPVTGPDGLPALIRRRPADDAPEPTEVPGWMPREVDNIAIHKAIFARWMKSAEWAMIDVGMRAAAAQYVKFLTDKEAERARRTRRCSRRRRVLMVARTRRRIRLSRCRRCRIRRRLTTLRERQQSARPRSRRRARSSPRSRASEPSRESTTAVSA